MTRNDGYASPGAVESAISAAARKASNADPSLTIQERIRLEYFHRFLSLYPVVDQVADKVCATLALYSGRPSSREKDLVDLVLLAVTQDVGAARLRRALEAEARARSLTLPTAFEIPAAWGARYAKLASRVAACSSHRSIGAAKELMRNFVDPVLDGSAANQSWDCSSLDWA